MVERSGSVWLESARCAVGMALVVALAGGAPLMAAAEENLAGISRRWQKTETPYKDMNVAQKVGSNTRQGLLGVVDSVGQGLFSAFRTAAPVAGLGQKVATVVGDVVGLVDNNPVTEHVFQGILSRQLLRFGVGARGISGGVAGIHDNEITAPAALPVEAYVGDRFFRPDVYTKNSVLAIVGAVVVSNVVIRPAGGLITVFGARETGSSLNEYGLQLIERSMEVPFF